MVCNFGTMRFLLYLILALAIVACAPQAAYFQVEVKDMQGADLNFENKQLAVFSVARTNILDSTRAANAALGLAEKIGQDRGFEDPLPVFSVSSMEFAGFSSPLGLDKEYLRNLMFTTGADMQLVVENLRYDSYKVESPADFTADYSTRIVELPYSVDLHVYDALEDSVLFKAFVKDTVYMQVLADTRAREFSGFVAEKLSDVSNVVGKSLGAMLSQQWYRQERMLVNYPGKEEWEKPLALAMEFKWKEAIALWMPLTSNENFRIAAYASYNIAVGCELLEQFALAREWADYSVKKFRFSENAELKEYLKKKEMN